MKIKKANFRQTFAERVPSTTYLTHGIHKYTAKMIPYIPRYFIEKYSQENDLVLDPFCGSGTTLLEAKLSSRNAIGIDINPLAVLISEVKTTIPNLNQLSLAIRLIKEKVKNCDKGMPVSFPNIDYWFCKEVQRDLSKIKFSIEFLRDRFSEDIIKFLLVCFSSIIRKSSYADPRMAKTYKSKKVRKKIEEGWKPTPIQYFEDSLDKNFERVKCLGKHLSANKNFVKVFLGDARKTSCILKKYGINEVDLIVTSPPYINAQDYFRSYKLEIQWLGLATAEELKYLNKETIGTEHIPSIDCNSAPKSNNKLLDEILRKIWKDDTIKANKKKTCIVYRYFENMKIVLREFYEVLTPRGHFCLVSGDNNICGFNIPTYKILTDMAKSNNFEVVEMYKDKIRNRALPPERNHRGGIIKEEWITIFKKVQ
jgi:DNA modification methylase